MWSNLWRESGTHCFSKAFSPILDPLPLPSNDARRCLQGRRTAFVPFRVALAASVLPPALSEPFPENAKALRVETCVVEVLCIVVVGVRLRLFAEACCKLTASSEKLLTLRVVKRERLRLKLLRLRRPWVRFEDGNACCSAFAAAVVVWVVVIPTVLLLFRVATPSLRCLMPMLCGLVLLVVTTRDPNTGAMVGRISDVISCNNKTSIDKARNWKQHTPPTY